MYNEKKKAIHQREITESEFFQNVYAKRVQARSYTAQLGLIIQN